jgi:hypothetical protein
MLHVWELKIVHKNLVEGSGGKIKIMGRMNRFDDNNKMVHKTKYNMKVRNGFKWLMMALVVYRFQCCKESFGSAK